MRPRRTSSWTTWTLAWLMGSGYIHGPPPHPNRVWHGAKADGVHGGQTMVTWAPTNPPANPPPPRPPPPKPPPGSNTGPPGSKQPPGALGHASMADGQMRVLHVNPAVT